MWPHSEPPGAREPRFFESPEPLVSTPLQRIEPESEHNRAPHAVIALIDAVYKSCELCLLLVQKCTKQYCSLLAGLSVGLYCRTICRYRYRPNGSIFGFTLHGRTCVFCGHSTQPFNGPFSGTTRVGWYRRNIHTHPDRQTSFINSLHLQRSITSSLFNLRARQFFSTTYLQVLLRSYSYLIFVLLL